MEKLTYVSTASKQNKACCNILMVCNCCKALTVSLVDHVAGTLLLSLCQSMVVLVGVLVCLLPPLPTALVPEHNAKHQASCDTLQEFSMSCVMALQQQQQLN